jgi:leucyl/phenylalanyl-tRNA---protein transferase
MPIYELPPHISFPPAQDAEPDGLLAVGGDLRPERLVAAYANGIFPWPHEGFPMLWFSPDPRMVLSIDRLQVARSLRQKLSRGVYEVRLDTAFAEVVDRCARVRRRGQRGTWITPELAEAFQELHRLGYAHSAEAWQDGRLVGGLYGISLGGAFFGESMFADAPDSSKVAFVTLVKQLEHWGFDFVDAQVHTPHLERFGAVEIPRDEYLAALRQTLTKPTRRGPWRLDADAT